MLDIFEHGGCVWGAAVDKGRFMQRFVSVSGRI